MGCFIASDSGSSGWKAVKTVCALVADTVAQRPVSCGESVEVSKEKVNTYLKL
jgi:hypothetical protein